MIRRAPCPVLVVDDSDDDLALMKAAWLEERIEHPFLTAEDGEVAVDYLSGQGRFSDRARHPLPCLLLLDLKMPGMTGFETLAWIRSQPPLKTLPVVVLTASLQPRDVEACYALGANSYLVKPSSFGELCALTRAIKGYWLEQNVFPGAAPTP